MKKINVIIVSVIVLTIAASGITWAAQSHQDMGGGQGMSHARVK